MLNDNLDINDINDKYDRDRYIFRYCTDAFNMDIDR